jgi:hypothetical protein
VGIPLERLAEGILVIVAILAVLAVKDAATEE